ncbi:hypothetical protein [Limihaloglobus sulfuriphilus]|nr:hypothetical protein [Limihaloglobus sulfuriphilus]
MQDFSFEYIEIKDGMLDFISNSYLKQYVRAIVIASEREIRRMDRVISQKGETKGKLPRYLSFLMGVEPDKGKLRVDIANKSSSPNEPMRHCLIDVEHNSCVYVNIFMGSYRLV